MVYLASQSPRRRALLEQIGVTYEVLRVSVPEIPTDGETPGEFARRVARDKARAGWRLLEARQQRPVLGADTMVVLDGRALGKPRDRSDAAAMLEQLSGRTHTVLSAVALVDGPTEGHCVNVSNVTFRTITPREIRAYLASGEGDDKAGAYGIQGLGAIFVARLEGSYSSVVGLPLLETARLLGEFGIDVLAAGVPSDSSP